MDITASTTAAEIAKFCAEHDYVLIARGGKIEIADRCEYIRQQAEQRSRHIIREMARK